MESICIITASLPPTIDGIGAYCKQLWRHSGSPQWHFLVNQGAQASKSEWQEVSISEFDRSKEGLLHSLGKLPVRTVVLQYAGYAFADDGQPFWLVAALRDWLSADSSRTLVVMVHETWSSGYPWQRVFWQRTQQKKCLADLLDLASFVVTSIQANLNELKSLKFTAPIRLIPIVCNLPVLTDVEKDFRQVALMARQFPRLRGLRWHGKFLSALANKRLIDRIVLAGECSEPASDPTERLLKSWRLPIEIVRAYNFSSDSLPNELLACGLSIMHSQSTCLLKSTSYYFAAEAGQVPIAIDEHAPGPPLISGKHYLSYRKGCLDEILPALAETGHLQEISSNVRLLAKTSLSGSELARSWRNVLDSVAR